MACFQGFFFCQIRHYYYSRKKKKAAEIIFLLLLFCLFLLSQSNVSYSDDISAASMALCWYRCNTLQDKKKNCFFFGCEDYACSSVLPFFYPMLNHHDAACCRPSV